MKNRMWGGRFAEGPDAVMEEINASIDFDQKLFRQDIPGSKAHARMLAKQGIIAADDAEKIVAGLDTILREIEAGTFTFSRALEDIHLNVEARLAELIGPAAGRLHTARSRNDQVATDFKLWVRDAIDDRRGARRPAAGARREGARPRRHGHAGLHPSADGAAGDLRPSPARLCRDDRPRPRPLRRCADAPERIAARRRGARRHLFPDRPRHDRGSARLRPADGQFARRGLRPRLRPRGARRGEHLRRPPLALRRGDRDLVVGQFGFVKLSDRFTTGSSIMPQKRNPDAAELVRAKTGRIVGALTALLIVMKGLPLAYSKDMQEDKEPVFDAFESLALSIAAMTGMVADMTPNQAAPCARRPAPAIPPPPTSPTGWCGRSACPSARPTTSPAGSSRRREKGVPLEKLPLAEMQAIEPRITGEVYSVLPVAQSVKSRTSYGGTAPDNVRREARRWLSRLAGRQAGERANLTRCAAAGIGMMARARPGVGRGKSGGAPVAPVDRRVLSRAVVIGLIAAAIGLSGCGRKGALEPPPGMAMKAATAGDVPPAEAPKKPDKPFLLDPLLK